MEISILSNYEGVSCFNETGWGSVFSSPVCPGKDSALEFCKNVYAELIALFPYKYVHIGGDEVEKTNWKKCPVRAGLVPLLGFDVWEHAYYLDYQNRRADHVNELWSIIDWDVVGKRLK